MGLTYEAEVFFGAFVPERSKLGKRLSKYIDKHEGTPAPTEIPGVEIVEVGDDSRRWLVARAVGSGKSFGQHEEPEEPAFLTSDTSEWYTAIGLFLADHAEPGDCPRIGWHFAGSVS